MQDRELEPSRSNKNSSIPQAHHADGILGWQSWDSLHDPDAAKTMGLAIIPSTASRLVQSHMVL